MPDPKIIELESKIAKLTAIINDPTPLYKEYLYKDDEKTIKPNLKLKHVDELNDALIRQSDHVDEFRESIKKEEIYIPEEINQSFKDVVSNKDTFINKGSVNWNPNSGFDRPSFSIENNSLYFRFKTEELIDYVEINEISPDGKSITTTQGGIVGDGEFLKVPVLIDYIENQSRGTRYTVAIVIGSDPNNQRKGFFTHVYK
jgi:hypothetical protein